MVTAALAFSAWIYRYWDETRAQREWHAAEAALARRDLSAAASHLSRYVTYRPNDLAGWFLAARTARRSSNYPEAKRYLAEYERLGGRPEVVQLERDLILVQQGIVGEIDYKLRATIGPDHPDVGFVLEALARGYLATERLADARQACELWRAVEPDHPWPWLWGGWVCERMAQYDLAGELYSRACERAPEDRDPHVALGRVLLLQRKPNEAAPHYEWLLARDPADPDGLIGLAHCWIESGRSPAARPLLEQALRREPSPEAAYVLMGRVAYETDDAAGAEPWLRRAVQVEPGNTEALHLLVMCLRAQGKEAEAELLARRLEELKTDLRRLHELLRRIGPGRDGGDLCLEAGRIALRVGRTQQGVRLLQDALRRNGNHRAAHTALAEHYRRIGKHEHALAHQHFAEQP